VPVAAPPVLVVLVLPPAPVMTVVVPEPPAAPAPTTLSALPVAHPAT
jgi:hypothetical protein